MGVVMKSITFFIFLAGLAVGILVGALGLRWATSHRPQTAATAAPEPRMSAPTPAEMRANMPVPSFPIMRATGTVIDVKNSSWNLRGLNNINLRFSQLAGKVLFVNSWGTWCAPCVAEMPYIQALCDSLRNDPVAFVVYSNEPIDTLRSFAQRLGLTMPIYQSVSEPPSKFDSKAWPTTFLLNSSGTIVYAEAGGAKWNDPSVIKFIRGLYH